MSELLQKVVHEADQRLAEDLIVLDFRGHSPFTDYFVIASAKNERMADSIVDHVIEEAEKAGYAVRNVEGGQGSRWLLVDLYEIVLHVFVGEERQVYNLEKLWGDLPRVEVQP